MSGRVVEVHEKIAATGILRIGSNWRGGIYFAEVIQGEQRRIIRINITSASAKIRTGPPKDADKDDWEDIQMRNRVWVGTIPVYETLGEPVTGEYSLVKEVPRGVMEYIGTRNGKEKGWSKLVTEKKLDLPLDHGNAS